MIPQAANSRPVVHNAIRSISHIATLPEVTLRIIDLVEDPSSTAQDLHKIIAHDPALCSRILKVVNSAFYGLPRQVGSINRAIVLLGLNAVKNIAIAASLTRLFRGGELCAAFSARDLWVHCIAVATGSKLICDELRLGVSDEGFLAGMIHDIGIMVEVQVFRPQLIKVFDEMTFGEHGVPRTDMREIERRIIGADHCEFGAELCEAWKFPTSFGYVAGHHHDPSGVPDGNRMLVNVVHVADRIAAELGLGFRGDISDTRLDPQILEEIQLRPAQLEQVMSRMPQLYEEVKATFG